MECADHGAVGARVSQIEKGVVEIVEGVDGFVGRAVAEEDEVGLDGDGGLRGVVADNRHNDAAELENALLDGLGRIIVDAGGGRDDCHDCLAPLDQVSCQAKVLELVVLRAD